MQSDRHFIKQNIRFLNITINKKILNRVMHNPDKPES